jgi:hypothetical protein
MRKLIVVSIAVLAALPAAALDNRYFPPNSALCWCICEANNPAAADGLPMWENKSGQSCKSYEGKTCNPKTPNVGKLTLCDGCQTNEKGECIAGSSAVRPANGTLLPAPPWEVKLTTKPLVPAGTAQPAR